MRWARSAGHGRPSRRQPTHLGEDRGAMVRISAVALAFLVLVGTSALAGVDVDFDHTRQFYPYRTFMWDAARGGLDAAVRQDVQEAIRGQLAERALQEVPEGADLLIVLHGAMTDEKPVTREIFPYGGYRDWDGWGTWIGGTLTPVRVWSIPSRTLIIDLVDASQDRLVWRAVAGGTLVAKPAQRKKRIGKSVTEAFEDFPPGKIQIHELSPEQLARMDGMPLFYAGEPSSRSHVPLGPVRGVSCFRLRTKLGGLGLKLAPAPPATLAAAVAVVRFEAAKQDADAVVDIRCDDTGVKKLTCREAVVCTGNAVRWTETDAAGDR